MRCQIDKLLPVIPDTGLDGFEREVGGGVFDKHFIYMSKTQIRYFILFLLFFFFEWFDLLLVIYFFLGGGGAQ